MKTRILIYQQKLLGKIPENDFDKIKALKANYTCLPEYFFHSDVITYNDAMRQMQYLSKELNLVLIGGTTVLSENNKLFNTSYIFDRGKEIGHYKKINLFHKEIGKITPGNEYKVFEVNNVNIGILICADVLHQDAWQKMALLKPNIIFIPTFSPYKEESIKEKFMRDEKIYVSGAKICGCPVIKVCGIGTYHDTKIQGRSLAVDKNSIIWRVAPEDEDKSIMKLIEIDI